MFDLFVISISVNFVFLNFISVHIEYKIMRYGLRERDTYLVYIVLHVF